MYRPVLDSVYGSLALTALVAMLPLLTLFVLLGVLRMTAWKAALVSLVVSLLVAVVAYSMPVGQAFMAGLEGAAFGFFPILWIVITRHLGLQHDSGHGALRRVAALLRQGQ